ncbi:hypothetical protein B0T18DRAFT_158620 [Schizothecium vesticola]|uniref:Uncharacterized protein n=1 Tax=Schizothecium vesticola TaxID=314040 RepID=A0AA40K5Z7_9PEZI|nr:hypothetical protein B0T18DRAFT_158620 [Schizothecium vesticola]
MAPGEWKGDANTTKVIIIMVVCWGWVPVIIAISLYRRCQARSRAKKDSANAAADLEKAPPRKPYVPMKQPEYVPMPVVARPERAASIRTFSSASSWEPAQRDWRDSASISYEPPRGSPADSLRPSPRHGSRTSFQINNAYYDTTPLPENAPSIQAAYAKSEAGRSQPRSTEQRRSAEQRRSMEAGPSNPPRGRPSARSTSRSRPAAKLNSTPDESPPRIPSLPPSALRPQPGQKQDPTSDESPPPMPVPPRPAARPPLKGILVSRPAESPPQMPPAPRSVSRPRGNATPADPRTRRPSQSSPPVAEVQTGAASSPSENPTEATATEALASRVPQPEGGPLRSQTSRSSLQNGGGTS